MRARVAFQLFNDNSGYPLPHCLLNKRQTFELTQKISISLLHLSTLNMYFVTFNLLIRPTMSQSPGQCNSNTKHFYKQFIFKPFVSQEISQFRSTWACNGKDKIRLWAVSPFSSVSQARERASSGEAARREKRSGRHFPSRGFSHARVHSRVFCSTD